jgi:hypothetical protein
MKNREAFLYLALLIVAVAIYSRSFDNSFRDDDFVFLHHVIDNAPAPGILKPSPGFAFYRPGAIALFYFEYGLFGLNGGLYLAFNFLLHVVISIVAMRALTAIGVSRHATVFAGALFVLGVGHYGKQVMWASTSGPLLSIVITLLTLMLTIRWMEYVRRSGDHGLLRDPPAFPLGVFLLLLVNPLFHEASLFTPLFLAIVVWLNRTPRSVNSWSRMALVFSPTVVWLLAVIFLARTHTAYEKIPDTLFEAPQVFLRYLGFMLFPVQSSDVAMSLPRPVSALVGVAEYVQLFAGTLVAVALAIALLRGRRPIQILTVWLIVAVVPASFVEIPERWLELRYLYYAAIPFCALLSYVFMEMFRRGQRWRAAGVAVFIATTVATSALLMLLERRYDEQSRLRANTERVEALRGARAEQ